jgi:hypothetical protein
MTMLNTIELDADQRALVAHAAQRAGATVHMDYTDGLMAMLADHRNCLGLTVARDEDAVIFEAVVGLRDPRLYGILTARRVADTKLYPCTIYWPGVLSA